MVLPTGSMQFFLADSLKRYTENFRLLTSENPYRFSMNNRQYSAHVSEIHFANRANPNEWRIQVPAAVRELQRRRREEGDQPLFIGFFPDGKVFTAWEPDYLFSLQFKELGSVYIPKDHWKHVGNDGAELDVKPARNLDRLTTKISLRADALGLYVENLQVFHSAVTSRELKDAASQLAAIFEPVSLKGEVVEEITIGGDRKKVTATRTAFARDPRFREKIMNAYAGCCCVCHRQLGLVQAAHIVPHSHPDSIDHVTNGLALCIEHHRLYDDALLLPTANGALHLNLDRVEHLENIGQDAGLNEVRALAAKKFRMPDDEPSRPQNDFLERGVRIRLGTDG